MDFQKKLREQKLYLLDMDGTLYLDDDLFPHCLDFLQAIRERGGDYLYLTNNSSKSVDKYVEKMERIGIHAVPEEFFTSTDASCVYLREHYHGNKLYALGTASFREQLKNAGFPVTDHLEDGIDGLIMGYDTELTYQKLDDACRLLQCHRGSVAHRSSVTDLLGGCRQPQGGSQQMAARIAYNEIDMLLFFRDPLNSKPNEPNDMNMLRLCDMHNIPVATNIATAEVLIHGLERGDLDWRNILK